jgi:hypothetical protein
MESFALVCNGRTRCVDYVDRGRERQKQLWFLLTSVSTDLTFLNRAREQHSQHISTFRCTQRQTSPIAGGAR